MSEAWHEQLVLLPEYLSRHLVLSLAALAVGIATSIPLAIVIARSRALRGPVLMVASAIQTIPGLALLALMVPLLGRIGFLPALIALILYSVLPILRNTVTGLGEVDANLIEAGTGLGMTPRQLLFSVQLPLAMPVIVAGIRTSAVWVVGMATLSTPVGATSLGNFIFSGLQTQNYHAVLTGCIAATALALALDRLIHLAEIALTRRNRPLLAGVLGILLAALVIGLWPAWRTMSSDAADRIVIGTKTFTEQYILGEVLAETLAARGFDPEVRSSLGSTVAFDALIAGRIDVYVDYTGTIWANHMGRTDNPGRAAMLRGVRDWLSEAHAIDLVAALGFENAYALAMTRTRADALGIASIDDLRAHAERLRIGGDYEFFMRPEWPQLVSRYDLSFASEVSMDSTLMYAAVARGEVDVVSAFSTDGRIPAFDLVVLEDSRGALPPYDAIVLIGPQAEARHPGMRAALHALEGTIDNAAMRAANRSVDIDGGSITAAAQSLIEGREAAP
jgi:osmoprotectant transport system substrate-binding protein/osmoprotectant transport system permease protein